MTSSSRWVSFLAACLTLFTSALAAAQTTLPSATTRLELLTGSKAEYRVREQLARLNFPNDAIGTTETVSGSLVIGANGAFAPGSTLTVDLRTLKSDEGRRDAFLRDNTLQTTRFPLAQFVPKRHQGLPNPLPATGTVTFQMIGDMTIHGVTSELSWNVVATMAPGAVSGQATTRFVFAKFGLTIPKLMGLLSVDDDIRLALDFKARRTATR